MWKKSSAWVWCLLWVLAAAVHAEPVVGASQSRVVFYRAEASAPSAALALQVRGLHHAALVPGAFSDMCFAAGEAVVKARELSGAATGEWRLAMDGGRSQYVRLDLRDGALAMQRVDEAQARRELQGLRSMSHMLSRAGVRCEAEPSPLAMRAVVRAPLAADQAWAEGAAVLSESGQRALQATVAQWRRDFSQWDRVRIVAHAQAADQLTLAAQRADAVREAVMGQGVRDAVHTEVQMLSQSPLAECAGVAPAQMAQACPLGPRLVVLEMMGVRR